MAKEYRIEGIVKNLSSLAGIPDLVVIALDIDFQDVSFQGSGQSSLPTTGYGENQSFEQRLMYDRLGSVLTDSNGRFFLEFDAEDFIQRDGDRRPDIMLVVTAPEISTTNPSDANFFNAWSLGANIMHISPPLRLKAGKIESYSIRIIPETLTRFRLDQPPRSTRPSIETVAATLENKRTYATSFLNLRSADINTRLLRENETLVTAANEVFSNFSLSSVSPDVLARDTFFTPSKNLSVLQRNIFDRKLSELESPELRTAFQVKFPPEVFDQLGLIDTNGRLTPVLPSGVLWDWWQQRNDTILDRRRRAYEGCIRPFREEDLDTNPPEFEELEPPENDSEVLEVSLDIKVNKLIECSTCPEEPLLYAKVVDPEYKSLDLRETINGLELIGGPTDVTSYYDFDSIQIAFESIWTEVFDDTLESLGKDIYAEIVRTADDTCADRLIRANRLNLTDPASLKSLLHEYRSITGLNINTRLNRLFSDLEQRLSEPYKFDVFAPNSYNFGVIFTYRQQWEPRSYQVGRLVKTIPLAPKEVRRYETKVSEKLTKAQKVIEDREFKGSSESTDTSRAESEIIARATNKTSFSTNAQGQLNMQMYNMQFGMSTGMDSEKFSSSTKKNFRESVLKAAQEYRKQTKLEVETASENIFENKTSGEISNPNEEISVTYLFYELQRQFLISEQLHRVTPIIAIAFEVPKPYEVDNDWLMTYGWIIRRTLLDESFHPALDYLMTSSVGNEVAIQEMGEALKRQKKLVDELNRELEIKNNYTNGIVDRIVTLMTGDAVVSTIKETGDFINGLLNPFAGLFGGGDSGPDLEKFKEVLELQLERSEKEQQRLEGRLREAQSDLQSVTQKFGEMTRRHFDEQTAIAQLRIHVKENILYYMQAIWDYEPPDQRYFRLYDLEIEWFEDPASPISTEGLLPRVNPSTGEVEWVEGEIFLPMGGVRRITRKLVDVADIDNLLGFKGNYAIFPVKEPNYIHLYMMKDYVDTQTGGLKDPDEFADVTTQELIDYLKCVRSNYPDVYESEKDRIIDLINERQRKPRREKDLVVVPTDSLYIECLPGKHAVLENFKLVHRAMDVKKVQAEIRKMELENLRFAERLLRDDTSDPEVDKYIKIEGPSSTLDIET